jgi:hypothetical protein
LLLNSSSSFSKQGHQKILITGGFTIGGPKGHHHPMVEAYPVLEIRQPNSLVKLDAAIPVG